MFEKIKETIEAFKTKDKMTQEEMDDNEAEEYWERLNIPKDELEPPLKKLFKVGFLSGRRLLREKEAKDGYKSD
jgi:hypothetical protein